MILKWESNRYWRVYFLILIFWFSCLPIFEYPLACTSCHSVFLFNQFSSALFNLLDIVETRKCSPSPRRSLLHLQLIFSMVQEVQGTSRDSIFDGQTSWQDALSTPWLIQRRYFFKKGFISEEGLEVYPQALYYQCSQSSRFPQWTILAKKLALLQNNKIQLQLFPLQLLLAGW